MTMPRNKDLKRLVRARMSKTGEAYTTARAHITRKSRKGPAARPAASTPKPKDYPAVAGMSDATMKQKTGCGWDRWVRTLDHHEAERMSHRDIAALVRTTYKIDGWWAQMVTVGYERIKGLRARGQRRDGTFEASKSRTYNVPVEVLFEAWSNARVRQRWFSAENGKVRSATAPKSMRLEWNDRTKVAVWFSPKGKSKSSVDLAHMKLPDRETVDRMKQLWSERLDALGEVLAER
jgi:hypothetical protein